MTSNADAHVHTGEIPKPAIVGITVGERTLIRTDAEDRCGCGITTWGQHAPTRVSSGKRVCCIGGTKN